MRLSLFSLGMLLGLTLIVTGCGDGKKTESPAPAPANATPGANTNGENANGGAGGQTSGVTSHPSQEVVRQFLLAMVNENIKEAFALFTPTAQAEYQKTGLGLKPEVFQGMTFRITGGDEVPDAGVGLYAVYVDMVNDDELIDSVWGVRKIGDEYRIANLLMSFDGDVMELNFEDPAGMLSVFSGDLAEPSAASQVPANNPQAMQQNPQAAQPFAPPQFDEGFQPPNQTQTAQPNIPNIQ